MVFVQITTKFNFKYKRPIKILVCGFETISVSPGAVLSYQFNFNIGN